MQTQIGITVVVTGLVLSLYEDSTEKHNHNTPTSGKSESIFAMGENGGFI